MGALGTSDCRTKGVEPDCARRAHRESWRCTLLSERTWHTGGGGSDGDVSRLTRSSRTAVAARVAGGALGACGDAEPREVTSRTRERRPVETTRVADRAFGARRLHPDAVCSVGAGFRVGSGRHAGRAGGAREARAFAKGRVRARWAVAVHSVGRTFFTRGAVGAGRNAGGRKRPGGARRTLGAGGAGVSWGALGAARLA